VGCGQLSRLPTARGDPQSPPRWTCKSACTLAAELTARRHPVSQTRVTQLLREGGHSLKGNRKTEEGDDHPDHEAASLKNSHTQLIFVRMWAATFRRDVK
jgi:hypothetical protein